MSDLRTRTMPAGWYPDAVQPGQVRYWDGQQWTEHVAPMAQQPPPLQPQAPAGSQRPFYRRTWFIAVVGVVFGLIVLGTAGGQEDPKPITPVAETDDDGEAERVTAPAPADVPVSVPDVVGLDEQQARSELEGAGLDVSVQEVEGRKEGEVLAQMPRPATAADEGTTVTLRVASGVVSVKIPDVTGMKLAAGRERLRAKGFDVDVSKKPDNSVPVGEIMKQSPTGQVEEGATISLIVAELKLTFGQENALGTAADYLSYTAFSREGLIEQLEFEGYSTKDATFAVDHLNVNWNEQAVKAAKDYLSYSSFSRQGLIEQLEFEGYTTEQATYGVNKAT